MMVIIYHKHLLQPMAYFSDASNLMLRLLPFPIDRFVACNSIYNFFVLGISQIVPLLIGNKMRTPGHGSHQLLETLINAVRPMKNST